MSKKDFIAIGNIFRATRPIYKANDPLQTAKAQQWERDLEAMIDFFADSNPKFDRVRFVSFVCDARE